MFVQAMYGTYGTMYDMYESKVVASKRVGFVIRQSGNLLSVDTDFAQQAGHSKVRTASIKSTSKF